MRTLILILLIGLVASCKKNHHVIHVKARNIVTGSGETYAGLKFSVVAKTPGIFEAHYKNVYEGYLDANGEATFDLKMKNNKSYSLGIELPEGTEYFNDLYFSLKHDLKNQSVIVEFVPRAYLKLIINNDNCLGSNDTLRLYQGNQIGTFDFTKNWDLIGCINWESPGGTDGCPLGYSCIPMGAQYFKWEVIKSGVTDVFYDTIYLDAGEYKTFEINY